jgi:nucleoside-diphosphate-sugar epimerase
MSAIESISGCRILVAGPSGQVARPVVAQLAKNNEVFALARFRKAEDEQAIQALGATTIKADLADDDLSGLPGDLDYALNYAVVKTGDFEYDLAANGEGAGRLMLACREVRAFVHFSSTAVYQYGGHQPRKESDPLGDNHRSMFPTYSICKIAAETVVRFVAREFEIPTTIARLSVPYGSNGGWPFMHLLMMKEGRAIDLHPDRPNDYNLLHETDYIAKVPALCAAASPAVTTLNFGGSEQVSIEQWCEYLSELTGLKPLFKDNPQAFGSLAIDTTRMHAAIGATAMPWKQGILDMVRALAPDLLKSQYR